MGFKVKSIEFSEVTEPKARLVAKGFSQIPGVDYHETFAPTPSASSIKLLVATAIDLDLGLFHLDAEQAFVQSKLDSGCGGLSNKIVRLNKSFYG